MQEVQRAISLFEELNKYRPINREQEERIMQKFRLDWNYHSNHLEGNSLTFGETKALILFGITAQGKPLKDHFEITGHDEAIKWVIEIVKKERPLTENFIRELHKLLLKESYQKEAITADGLPTKRWIEVGKYKSVPNHVKTKTGEIFYFAKPEETPALMSDLMDWYNAEIKKNDIVPILLAAQFHYKFIRIHPFDDGNGRTARILMNFILMKFGYPPVIIKTEDKDNYFAVLRLADTGQIEPFIEYIAQNLIRSLEIMIAGAKGENIEEADDIDKEIALLEQKIKNNFAQQEDLIINFRDLVIKEIHPTFIKFIQNSNKFDNLYNQKTINISIINHTQVFSINYNEMLKQLLKYISNNTKSIALTISYKKYKQEIPNLEYEVILNYEFKKDKYQVFISESINKKARNITNEDFDEVLKSINKHHINFINQKIEEAQKQKL